MVGGKSAYRIRAKQEGFQGLNPVDLEVEIFFRFRRQEAVARKVSLKCLRGSFNGFACALASG
jgi:hypothetical protein